MTALRIVKKVENDGVFIPPKEFNNQKIEIDKAERCPLQAMII